MLKPLLPAGVAAWSCTHWTLGESDLRRNARICHVCTLSQAHAAKAFDRSGVDSSRRAVLTGGPEPLREAERPDELVCGHPGVRKQDES